MTELGKQLGDQVFLVDHVLAVGECAGAVLFDARFFQRDLQVPYQEIALLGGKRQLHVGHNLSLGVAGTARGMTAVVPLDTPASSRAGRLPSTGNRPSPGCLGHFRRPSDASFESAGRNRTWYHRVMAPGSP